MRPTRVPAEMLLMQSDRALEGWTELFPQETVCMNPDHMLCPLTVPLQDARSPTLTNLISVDGRSRAQEALCYFSNWDGPSLPLCK